MGSWKFEGLDAFINLNFETIKRTDRIVGRSIYPGAKYIANAVKSAIVALPVDDSSHRRRIRQSITTAQKEGLLSEAEKEGFGIAKMKKGRFGYNVKLGFAGYNKVYTKRWPNGQPNAMIARSLNSGTSFLKKNPFMDVTVERCKDETVRIIENEFNEQIERIWSKR